MGLAWPSPAISQHDLKNVELVNCAAVCQQCEREWAEERRKMCGYFNECSTKSTHIEVFFIVDEVNVSVWPKY